VVGCGTVGRELLVRLAGRRTALADRIGSEITVIAVADSTGLLALAGGLGSDDLGAAVRHKAAGGAVAEFAPRPVRGSEHCVVQEWDGTIGSIDLALDAAIGVAPEIVIDVTDAECGPELAALRGRGPSLVLANKRPLAGSLDQWRDLTRPHASGSRVRWEATVASSLPVVATVRALADIGDPPHELIGALSGTLGTVFAAIVDGLPPSHGLAGAVARGLAEPDPRRDLCGIDVASKALILARTAGFEPEPGDVSRLPLCGVDWEGVALSELGARLDEESADLVAVLRAGRPIRYLARATADEVAVSLAEAPAELALVHPANSATLIRSAGFGAFPLVLSGRGGGAGAAADAVLVDVAALVAG
jgi:homoserine dehydrogenase